MFPVGRVMLAVTMKAMSVTMTLVIKKNRATVGRAMLVVRMRAMSVTMTLATVIKKKK